MLNQNQFAQSPIKGQLDLNSINGTLSCQVDASEAGTLVPGQAVKMFDSSGGVPKVVAAALDTDSVIGFVNYSQKNATFKAGAPLEISFDRNVMYMEASAAIARGATVGILVAGSKVLTAIATKAIVGRALDKAVNAGDLIRVYITAFDGRIA